MGQNPAPLLCWLHAAFAPVLSLLFCSVPRWLASRLHHLGSGWGWPMEGMGEMRELEKREVRYFFPYSLLAVEPVLVAVSFHDSRSTPIVQFSSISGLTLSIP